MDAGGDRLTRISGLGLCFVHRTLLLAWIQRICNESKPREISEPPMTRSFRLTGPFPVSSPDRFSQVLSTSASTATFA